MKYYRDDYKKFFADWFDEIVYDVRMFFRHAYLEFQWHYLSLKSYFLGRRKLITLREFLETGSFGGIRFGITPHDAVEILQIAYDTSHVDSVWGIDSLEIGFHETEDGLTAQFIKYNCNKFRQTKPYPPTIHIEGYIPKFRETTMNDFIGYLESEQLPYEVYWEEFEDIRIPHIYVNDATDVIFAEDDFMIIGIYPKRN